MPDLHCKNIETCQSQFRERGSRARTQEQARVAGWHIFEGTTMGGKVVHVVLCPKCVGKRSRAAPTPIDPLDTQTLF